ncbi:MAG: TIGR03086 family metal-binding protein [Acidimicrobiales bacterium]
MTNTDASPATPIDTRLAFHAALDTATPLIAGVRADQLDGPTPCDDMDVRHLLAHLVFVAERVASMGRGVHPMDGPTEEVDRADDAWPAAWEAAKADVLAVWADEALLDREIVLPWTATTGRDTMALYAAELTTHTWDLARATGQEGAWDADALEVALDAMRKELPVADRTEMWAAASAQMPPSIPWRDPFANAVDVAEGAPLVEQLVAWCGRDPRWQA